RSVDRQAGPQRGLARRVLPAAGGKHLAEISSSTAAAGSWQRSSRPRSVDRQAGPQRGLARRVLPAAGGKHLAEISSST
ncbi:hypothetical protein BHG04_29145, partial [Klebsiella pneumoniae]